MVDIVGQAAKYRKEHVGACSIFPRELAVIINTYFQLGSMDLIRPIREEDVGFAMYLIIGLVFFASTQTA
jgi:hypothetical protein